MKFSSEQNSVTQSPREISVQDKLDYLVKQACIIRDDLHKRESEQNLQEVIARYDMKAQTISDSLDKMFDVLQKFDASKYSKEALIA